MSWRVDSRIFGGLLYGLLVLCLGERRAELWYRPVVWTLIGMATATVFALLAAIVYELAIG